MRAGGLTVLLLLVAAPAFAQTEPTPEPAPPVRSAVDENGVDVTTGALNFDEPGVSIGPAFPHGLSYSNQSYAGGSTPGAVSIIQRSGSTYVVSVGGDSDRFTLSGTTFTPTEANGSSLTKFGALYTYTSRSGVVATFTEVTAWGQDFARPGYVQFPDGTRIVYTYRNISNYCPGGVEGGICPADGGYRLAYRLQSITNNHGYQLKISYATNTLNDLIPATTYEEWTRLTSVTALNNAVDYCDPTTDSCSTSQTWPSVSYAESSGSRTITDAAGQVTTYSFGSGTGGIMLPGSSSDDISFTTGSDGIATLTRFGVTHSYAVSTSGTTRTTTVTDANSNTRVYRVDTANMRLTRFTDELGRVTEYTYDSNGRLTRIDFPLLNHVDYSYDARGNVTEVRQVAVSGSGLSDIVTTASFDSSCSNALTCNQPNSTTDARGNTTDYTYSSTHGGVLTVTAPAPTSGAARPQTRTTYAARQAYYKVTSSSIVASGDNVYLPTQVSACVSGTSSTCLGGADEVRTTIDWGPQTSGTANNLLPVSTTSGDGGGSLAATSAATYDSIGNIVTIDGPLSGTDDTTTFRYDALRRRAGVISPDPDGSGSMLRRAQRTTYASTGLISQIDQGTVTGTSDSAWAAFTTLQSVALTHDANRRAVRQRLLSSTGSTEAVRDLSYDDLARPECVATRMNPSAWSTLTAACTAQTAGSHGPDRIVRSLYDLAGQPTQSQEAYGTALQTTVATRTYTSNGRLETLTDGENNRTTWLYDGHDRLSRTRMPSTTQGSGTSSTTDYEELSYDANGNVTNRRLRDDTSIAFGYDALGRLTSRDTPNAVWQDRDSAFTYDNLGRRLSATMEDWGSGWTLGWSYDALGRMTGETSFYGTKTMAYDLAGRLTRITWPDSFYADYDHLVTGEVSAVRENGATSGIGVLATYTYDNLGRRTGITRGNGATTAYSYDAASRLSQLVEDMSGSTNDLILGFSYNPAAQITGNTRSNDAYSYTARTNGSVADTINGLNQVTATGSTSLSYDGRGNISGIGGTGYVYASDNRLVTVGVTDLAYDAAGRLAIVYTSTQQRMDMLGGSLITELDGSNAITRRYVHGPGVDEPLVWYEGSGTSDRRWLHADERGSIVAVSNDSGSVTNVNSYDEYGRPASANVARFGYTGQAYISEIGLWYYRARMYNPSLGRFMQTDPIGYGSGMNLYAYVGGDPVNLSDPLGLCQTQGDHGLPGTCVQPVEPPPDETVRGWCRGASCDSRPGTPNAPGPAPSSPGGPGGRGGSDCNLLGCAPEQDVTVTGRRPRVPVRYAQFVGRDGFPIGRPRSPRERDQDRDFCGTAGLGALVPDSIGGIYYGYACASHDNCYASATDRRVCDEGLRESIWTTCTENNGWLCDTIAIRIYYDNVRRFGRLPYILAGGSGNPD